MRRQAGRQGRRHFHRGRVVPGIRRYLLCLRNDASDTDSDSIPLSSLLDDDDADTDAVDYSSALLTPLNVGVRSVNPTVCTGLMQVSKQLLIKASTNSPGVDIYPVTSYIQPCIGGFRGPCPQGAKSHQLKGCTL